MAHSQAVHGDYMSMISNQVHAAVHQQQVVGSIHLAAPEHQRLLLDQAAINFLQHQQPQDCGMQE